MAKAVIPVDPLYFESHITIEPVFGERLELFTKIVKKHAFRPAKLLMQKDRESTPERSNKDTFCTGHANNYLVLHGKMTSCAKELQEQGFSVWRYKIESVLLDVKIPREVIGD